MGNRLITQFMTNGSASTYLERRVNTYIDVLGDPQSHSDAVIKKFEAL